MTSSLPAVCSRTDFGAVSGCLGQKDWNMNVINLLRGALHGCWEGSHRLW